MKLSEEHKQKLSESKKGKKNPFFGKTHTDEVKKKMRESHKGEKHHNFGKHLSKETREKIRKANSGKKNGMYGVRGEQNPLFKKDANFTYNYEERI